MKTLRIILIIAATFGSLVRATPAIVRADTATIDFEQLKLQSLRMRGPQDSFFVSFAAPEHWGLEEPSSIELDLDIIIPGDSTSGAGASNAITDTSKAQLDAGGRNCVAGTLNFSFNNTFLRSVPLLGGGSRKVSVPIKADALKPAPGSNNQHQLFVQFENPDRCGVDQYTQILVQPTSRFQFSKTDTEPTRDLTLLPRPLLQRTFEPDRAMLVVPDAPSAEELEAALNVAAGFGRMTSGALAITTTAISRMSDTMWKNNHLIIVGKPFGLPIIGITKLTEPLSSGKFNLPNADDGIVQLAVSPYNRERVVLIVSGNSDVGVAKAGRAVSSGAVRPKTQRSVAVIANAGGPRANTETPPDTRSFTDLGYATQRAQGLGGNTFFIEFNAPNAVSLVGDGYIELAFVHSALLDYDRSNLNIFLNDIAIGSVRLSDASTRIARTRVPIPEAALRPGNNRIAIQSTLSTRSNERNQPFDAIWMSIQDDSQLFMRFSSKPARPTRANLAGLLKPFNEESNLGNVGFVLPERDPAAWKSAADLAYVLGIQSSNTALDVRAALASKVPETLSNERNLIVIGKAAELPFLTQIPNLPAPFEKGSNIASEANVGVSNRVAPTDNMGYLQFVQSPFNPQRAILFALGSTDAGIEWASRAIADPNRRSRLTGNLAFINDEQIVPFTVRVQLPGDTAANNAAPVPAATIVAANPANSGVGVTQPAPGFDPNGRLLLFILAGLIGAAIVIIVASALISQRRNRQNNLP